MSSGIPSLTTRLIGCLALSSLFLIFLAGPAEADCGCHHQCHACTQADDCQCDCRLLNWPKRDCLAKALANVGGCVKNLWGRFKCRGGCDDAGCDDACDAAMINELMMTDPQLHYHHGQLPMHIDSQPLPYIPDHSEMHVPEPVMRLPETDTHQRSNDGSLFDTFSNPFEDDNASADTFRNVRPSNYTREVSRSSLGPHSTSPIYQSYRRSRSSKLR